ncbi:MAG: hypothetical protein RLZZ440_973 [Planctomycetota bacterium]|jgi:hypothetical protein
MTADTRGDLGHAVRAAAGWQLERRSDGGLDFLAVDGVRHADADLRRAFPLSAPEAGLAVVSAKGHELAWVESLATTEPALRMFLQTELERREFVPVIERIESISEARPAEWSVVTDRGPHRFTVAHPDDVARRPEGTFVTDTDGIRYRLAPEASLDDRSRRILERL